MSASVLAPCRASCQRRAQARICCAIGSASPDSRCSSDEGSRREHGVAGFMVTITLRHLAVVQRSIQTRLGHVDTDVIIAMGHVTSPGSRPCRIGLLALATVRDVKKNPPLRPRLIHDLGIKGLTVWNGVEQLTRETRSGQTHREVADPICRQASDGETHRQSENLYHLASA